MNITREELIDMIIEYDPNHNEFSLNYREYIINWVDNYIAEHKPTIKNCSTCLYLYAGYDSSTCQSCDLSVYTHWKPNERSSAPFGDINYYGD